jgi:GAF domain-containing protein
MTASGSRPRSARDRREPIEEALCVYALSSGALFVVPDAAADARFRDNRFVVGRPHIRF